MLVDEQLDNTHVCEPEALESVEKDLKGDAELVKIEMGEVDGGKRDEVEEGAKKVVETEEVGKKGEEGRRRKGRKFIKAWKKARA